MAGMSRQGTRRDPRSPFVLDVSELGRRPGGMQTLHETVPSPSRIGVELLGIAEGAPIDLDLRLESVPDGILVTGTAAAPAEGECARCLTPVTDHVNIDLAEFFAYPDSEIEADAEEDEVGHVTHDDAGDTVDIEQPIIDAVGMALPFSPLCTHDCPGLCVECGIPLASAEPGHGHDAIDPRWAKLAAMIPADEVTDQDGSTGAPR